MATEIDFATIQDARRILQQIVADNPNLISKKIDSLEYLDEMTKSSKQRIIDYRERMKDKGYRGLYVYIHDDDRRKLENLSLQLDMTLSECVSYLLDQRDKVEIQGDTSPRK